MVTNKYLKWLCDTPSFWWNDSAVLGDMDQAIENGATGVTTNPLLVKRSLYGNREAWKPFLAGIPELKGDEKAEELIRRVTVSIAKKFEPIYNSSEHAQGYVCAQVNPKYQGDSEKMLAMGKRLAKWAPNIAVKLPATAAGLDVAEELAALGITTVGTVSFTVPQALEIARRQQLGRERAIKANLRPAAAFSVIMVGRLDDYLRDVAHDMHAPVKEEDIIQAGTACIKRSFEIFRERGYEAKLMPAGMRGAYQATALAGADLSMSLSSGIHTALDKETVYTTECFEKPVDSEVIERLRSIPDFSRAYEQT